MTLYYKELSLQHFRQPSGDFSHCLHPSTLFMYQHHPEGSAPKARAAGKATHALQLCLMKYLAMDTSSSLDSLAVPGEAPVLLKAGAGESTGLAWKNRFKRRSNNEAYPAVLWADRGILPGSKQSSVRLQAVSH